MRKRSGHSEIQYHLARARIERDVAYRSDNALAADAHMRLSALHLHRALLLQTVTCKPVGNVFPLRSAPRQLAGCTGQAAAGA